MSINEIILTEDEAVWPMAHGLSLKTEMEEVYVKEEAKCENKETGAHVKEEMQCEDSVGFGNLYAGHQVKDELMLGPVELHRPCVLSAPPAALNKDEASQQACSFGLERSSQLGLHTCKLTDMGTFFHCTFSRMYIFELWCDVAGACSEKARYILQSLLQLLPDDAEIDIQKLQKRIDNLSKQLSKFWKKENRARQYVISKHSEWLSVVEGMDLHRGTTSSSLVLDNTCHNSSKLGRPKKEYDSCSDRIKRRRLAEFSQMDKSAVNSLVDIPTDSIRSEVNVDEVLSLFMETKLTKHQYQSIQKYINSKNNPVLPSYAKILQAKKRCYPGV